MIPGDEMIVDEDRRIICRYLIDLRTVDIVISAQL